MYYCYTSKFGDTYTQPNFIKPSSRVSHHHAPDVYASVITSDPTNQRFHLSANNIFSESNNIPFQDTD